jgi:hypothetical protein
MPIYFDIKEIVEALSRGEPQSRTVGQLKRWFGVERRGPNNTAHIVSYFSGEGIRLSGGFDDPSSTKDDDVVHFSLASLERHSSLAQVINTVKSELVTNCNLQINAFLQYSHSVRCMDATNTIKELRSRMGRENIDQIPIKASTDRFIGFVSWRDLYLGERLAKDTEPANDYVKETSIMPATTSVLRVYDEVQRVGHVAVEVTPGNVHAVYVVDRGTLGSILLKLALPTIISSSLIRQHTDG